MCHKDYSIFNAMVFYLNGNLYSKRRIKIKGLITVPFPALVSTKYSFLVSAFTINN